MTLNSTLKPQKKLRDNIYYYSILYVHAFILQGWHGVGVQSIKVDENQQSMTFASISSSESAVAVLRTSSQFTPFGFGNNRK